MTFESSDWTMVAPRSYTVHKPRGPSFPPGTHCETRIYLIINLFSSFPLAGQLRYFFYVFTGDDLDDVNEGCDFVDVNDRLYRFAANVFCLERNNAFVISC